MLKLKNITKDYLSGDLKVSALKGIDLEFRENEFVSILGPSGCGKTTLLNIIGGLDRYTTGDLIINGKSTKEFKDRDWDAYRNYSVGFVFQNYNLISHQTILSNVELALTLSGVSKDERRKRAIKALKDVGLEEQINKKPNQLSGGQMQRVAIARALVNDPDIILADEPTGALDTKTSVQIMDILKKISKNKLIVMVTHNPELAEKYSSRVIRILDGKITDDTNPYHSDESKKEKKSKIGKTSMKFFTAVSLSLNNLMTKKGRTFLTAFAGSIGIIGIALILSLSNGMQEYINRLEEDTLSSYPITIEKSSLDLSSMMSAITPSEEETQKEENKIYSRDMINDIFSMMSAQIEQNDLKSFKNYLENEENDIVKNSNAIQYGYDLNINLYSTDTSNGVVKVNPSQVLSKLGFGEMEKANSNSPVSMFTSTDVFEELLDNDELLDYQFDILAGKMPTAYNELLLIVDENNEISDYTLYALGLKDQNELEEKFKKIQNGETIEKEEKSSYTYDDLLNLKFKLVLNTDFYEKQNNVYVDRSDDEEYMNNVVNNAEEIKIVGIAKYSEESVSSVSYGMVGYTKELKEYVINKINSQEIVMKQKENPNINVFTGTEFTPSNTSFSYANLTNEQKAYLAGLSQEELAKVMETYTKNANATYDSNLETLGVVDLDSPSSISIYPKDFDSKEIISSGIDKYNDIQRENQKEENVITYNDLVGVMMNSVSSIINIISYVLIAFVSISLVVSSIMIGIITYISVLERTKEIGILRSIGASKKDISRVFNAETLIVGLIAGLLGIAVTLLLNIPINIIIKNLVGISNISVLPPVGGVILVIISVVLTVIAGLIPAKMASRKDPVEALRVD